MSTSTDLGHNALANNAGQNNTAVGYYAASQNTSGSNNTAMGSNALLLTTTASNNTAVGAGAMCNNVTGDLNCAFGSSALEGLTSETSVGDDNVAVGAQALYINQGDANVALGNYAGISNSSGMANTFLGTSADISAGVSAEDIHFSTAVGANAKITAANQVMLGGADASGVFSDVVTWGDVGVKTDAPAYPLDVSGQCGLGAAVQANDTSLWLINRTVLGTLGNTSSNIALSQNTSGATQLNAATGQAVNVGVGNGSAICVSSAGNVGINSNQSPQYALDVSNANTPVRLGSLTQQNNAGSISIINTTYLANLSNASGYALAQNTLGATTINSAAGQAINMSINNATPVVSVTSAGVLTATNAISAPNAIKAYGTILYTVGVPALINSYNVSMSYNSGTGYFTLTLLSGTCNANIQMTPYNTGNGVNPNVSSASATQFMVAITTGGGTGAIDFAFIIV